jgi:xylulokinase
MIIDHIAGAHGRGSPAVTGLASPPHVLAVDLGTSCAKVALVSSQGRVAGWESEPLRVQLLPDGGAEQDPEEWWRALGRAARRLLARDLAPRASVAAVCCSAQGEGTVAVDAAGRPLMNAVLWMDMRGAPHLRRTAGGPLRVGGFGVLKLARWLRLTGGLPSLTGKDPAGHMLFIKHERPQVYERTDKFLNVLDYLNLRLCGAAVATYDSILTSWVTDNRDPARVAYDPRLVALSTIEREKFPPLVKNTDVIGTLRAEAAEQLGLPAGVKVVAGAVDNTSAAVGSGAVEMYDPHLYVGTSSWIAAHVPRKKTDLIAYLASTPCALPDRYLVTALQTTAGGSLTFLKDQVLGHPDGYEALDRAADRAPAGSHGLIYTPWLWGERAPVEDRSVRAGFFNLSLRNTREDLVRAVLEGVAYNTRWLLDPVQRFLGRPLQTLNFVGGGARSDVWAQILADVLNLGVRQVSDPIQANARGAALIAAVGLGEIGFGDVPRLTEYRRTYEPRAEHRRLYDGVFQEFVNLYRKTRPIYRRLNG